MGGHIRYRRRSRMGHSHDGYSGPEYRPGYPPGSYSDPRLPPPRSIPRVFVVIALVVWSLLAWVGYVSVDTVIGWAAALADVALTGGRDVAGAVGLGKEVGGIADGLWGSGLLDQAFALLRWIAKPLIAVVWAVGALALAAAPVLLSRFRGLRIGSHH